MTSKPPLTPTPSSPALVRRVAPVVAAASIITGCLGDPGDPGGDAAVRIFDAGRSRPSDAFVGVSDAGISIDGGFGIPDEDAAITADARSEDTGPISADDAD